MQLESMISSSDYNSSTQLTRVTAFMLKLINYLKLRVASEIIKGPLTAIEYQQAEFLWIKSIWNLGEKNPISNRGLDTLDCMKTMMEFNDAKEDLEMQCCHLMQGIQYFYPQTTT